MAERKYLNREIDSKLDSIQTIMEAGFDDIRERQNYTNSKVAKNTEWRWMSMGALAIISTFLVPILFWAVHTLTQIDVLIEQAVKEHNETS